MSKKIPVIVDLDVGDDITDAFALAFALKSSNLDIKAFISNNGYEKQRAKIIHKFLSRSGSNIPVFQGVRGGIGRLSNQKDFIRNYSYNPPLVKDNLDFFKKLFPKNLYLSLGTLTNLNYFLKNIKGMEKTPVFMMGGAINKDYHGRKKHVSEWNFYCDVPSAKNVFESKIPISLVTLDSSWDMEIPSTILKKILDKEDRLNRSLNDLYRLWKKSHKRRPIEYDSLTVALAANPSLASYKTMTISIDDKGKTILDKNGKKIKVASRINKKRFWKIFEKTLLEN